MKSKTLSKMPIFIQKVYINKLIKAKNWDKLISMLEGELKGPSLSMIMESVEKDMVLFTKIIDYAKSTNNQSLLNIINVSSMIDRHPVMFFDTNIRNKILSVLDERQIVELYSHFIKGGYTVTEADLLASPVLCSDLLIVGNAIEKEPSLIMLSKVINDDLASLVIKNGYIPSKEDFKRNLALKDSELLLSQSLTKDIAYLEFADLKNEKLFVVVLNQIKKILSTECQNNIMLIEKAMQNSSLNNEELRQIYRLQSLCSSGNTNFMPEEINLNNIDLNRIKNTLPFHYQTQIDCFENATHHLTNFKVANGKYHIPKEYLQKEIIKLSKNGNEGINIFAVSNSFDLASMERYIKYDGYFDDELGKEIEHLFLDPNIIFGIHGSRDGKNDSVTQEKVIDSYFNRGLYNAKGPDIKYTVKLQNSETGLQDFLGYTYSTDPYKYVVAIPREGLIPSNQGRDGALPLWQIDEHGVAWLLPQYIYGCVDLSNPEARITHNPNYGKQGLATGRLAIDNSLEENFKSNDEEISNLRRTV